jgi:glycosyltransferase involved in cell wall biosynthesis
LLDVSSGASMSVRQMLLQLQRAGWDVSILGATVFDDKRGTTRLTEHWTKIRRRPGQFVDVKDGALVHRLIVTAGAKRAEMTSREESAWYHGYVQTLEQFRPDIIFYYGGQPFDYLIAGEARRRGIGVAFYLVNANYQKDRWCRDVDLIVTDSHATADLYSKRLGLDVRPVGKFIDPSQVVASERTDQRILFINPLPTKGAYWVVALALWLEHRRPDIIFEVVESRGRWSTALRGVTSALGCPRTTLENVVVTPNTQDMRPVYSRARLLLAPSLWWESGSRVLVEAMLNGIPPITTDCGGAREMVQDGGILVRLPDKYHERPYSLVPAETDVVQLATLIESLYDDQARYESLAQAALKVGQRVHGLEVSTARLLGALAPFSASANKPVGAKL